MSILTWVKAISAVSFNITVDAFVDKLVSKPADLTRRKHQVFSKRRGRSGRFLPLMDQDWKNTDCGIQKHNATRRGKHYDIRFIHKNRAISFASTVPLPSKQGSIIDVIRTPDHKPGYIDFEGVIPKGEYGAGTVKLDYLGKIMYRIRNKNNHASIKLLFHEGKYKGLYSFFELGNDVFRVYKTPVPPNIRISRRDYKLITREDISNIPEFLTGEYVMEEKMDGAYSALRIGEHASSITGRRASSIDGTSISYNEKLPHILELKSRKYTGTVLTGEIYSDKGFGVTSGILNSNPTNALDLQNQHGKVDFYAFDINKLMINGKEIKFNNYKDKRIALKELKQVLSFDSMKLPESAINHNSKLKLMDNIKSKEFGEGVILKDVENESKAWYKCPYTELYDLKITDFTEGTGKYKGKAIGAITVSDSSGKYQVNVGSGLTDSQRYDIYSNKKDYIGKIVKVKARKITDKSLVAPRFVGFHPGKTKPDLLNKRA